jgi:hypothetical protein
VSKEVKEKERSKTVECVDEKKLHDKCGCLWKSDVGLEAKYLYVSALYAMALHIAKKSAERCTGKMG